MTNGHDDETRAMGSEDPEATRAFDPLSEPADETHAIGPGAETTRPHPSATERIVLPQRRSMAGWLVALALLVALGVGVALGYSQSEGGTDGIVAQALVGPGGGVLEFDGEGRLEIPANALPTLTAITVRRIGNDNRIRLGPEGDPSSSVHEPGSLDMYAFEPADLAFQQPVTITLPRPEDAAALLIDTTMGLRVVAADANQGTVTVETSSFTFEEL